MSIKTFDSKSIFIVWGETKSTQSLTESDIGDMICFIELNQDKQKGLNINRLGYSESIDEI